MGGLPTGIYSAPDYLERAGVPQHPRDLANHDCLLVQHFFERLVVEWPLTKGAEQFNAGLRPVAVASDPEALHSFLLGGDGLLMTNHLRVAADVAAGRLVRVLPDWDGPEPILYAVRPSGRVQPPKVTAFLDFLAPRLDLNKAFPMPCALQERG
jgi:DNA-binding transcriptional LysR family regulator